MLKPETIKHHKEKKLGVNCPTCLREMPACPEPPMWILAVIVSIIAVGVLVMAHMGR